MSRVLTPEVAIRRCQAVGWHTRRTRTGVKVTKPDGQAYTIHLTVGDNNEGVKLARQLKELGLPEAEAAMKGKAAKERQRAIDADRAANEAKVAKLQARNAKAVELAAGPYAFEDVPASWFLSPHPGLATRNIMLTPELAAAFLERNHCGRKLKDRSVARFASIIESGHWQPTHQGIAFDTEGYLCDGQNRCGAVVECGIAVPVPATVGVAVSAFAAIDTGRNRSAGDAFVINGVTHYSGTLAAVTRLMWLYWHVKDPADWRRSRPEHDAQVDLYFKHREIIDPCLPESDRVYKKIKLPRAPFGAAISLIRHGGTDPSIVNAWVGGLESGENLNHGDARIALARVASNFARQGGRREGLEYMALVLKAWKSFVENKPITVLSWEYKHGMPPVHTLAIGS